MWIPQKAELRTPQITIIIRKPHAVVKEMKVIFQRWIIMDKKILVEICFLIGNF